MSWRIIRGDCVERMRKLDDASMDAAVCDPPYGLEFMGKDWDAPWREGEGFRPTENVADVGRANAFGQRSAQGPEYRAGVGFQEWCERWAAECLRILKPGGHLLAFGGTRTYHRLAAGIEDAGFEIRDCLAWLFGSGFPKSLDVSKAIDKPGGSGPAEGGDALRQRRVLAGLSRVEVAEAVGCSEASVRDWEEGRARARGGAIERIVPSLEVRDRLAELLGYPSDARVVVGECRDRRGDGTTYGLGHTGIEYAEATTTLARRWQGWGTALKPAHEPIVVARKPLAGTVVQNVLALGTGALNVDTCRIGPRDRTDYGLAEASRSRGSTYGEPSESSDFDASLGRWPANVVLDDEATAQLDSSVGPSVSRVGKPRGSAQPGDGWRMTATGAEYDDHGGPSRFFYVAKASRTERNAGLDGFEERRPDRDTGHTDGRQWDIPGSHSKPRANHHPTVKPIDLMRWLCRLVTPPGGTVLDPFAGSGTTGIAAVLEGFQFIGIERDHGYADIAEARISWWHEHRGVGETAEVLAAGETRERVEASGQMALLDGEAA